LEGPAASEEASQYPVLFDTLEYRQQNPKKGAVPQVPERRAGARDTGRKRKRNVGTVDDRPTGTVSTARK
jgi:hypothetical protein